MVLHSCLLLSHLPTHSHPREIFIFTEHILCLPKKCQFTNLSSEYGSTFLSFIIPSPTPISKIPEKSSPPVFTASCEHLPSHETTCPVNLVITPIQLLLLFCLFLFNSIMVMVWFSITHLSKFEAQSSSSSSANIPLILV